jgi:Carboxypeptidase regulatory-like domain
MRLKTRGGKCVRALAAALVAACLCAEAAASCGYDPSPPCQAFWHADVVFVGTVVELTYSEKYRAGEGENRWDRRDRVARFSVEEVFRGEAGPEVKITATEILPTPIKFPDGSHGMKHISTSDCEYTFKPGERYVVYARMDKERAGTLRVGLNRTRPLALAAEDLAFLRGLKTADPTGRVYGRVVRHDRDLKDGNYVAPAPVEGVRVEVTGEGGAPARFATSDHEGFYEVTGLAPGKYVVRPEMPETLAAYGEQKAQVVARGCAQVDFRTHSDGRVSGRVTDSEGRPVFELKVDLIHADGPEISLKGLWAHTDREGRYELKGVPPGRYLLGFGLGSEPDARAPFPRTFYPGVARAAQATALEVGPGQKLTLFDLRLPPRHSERAVEVVVVWPDGRPVNDALLRLENVDYSWSSNATRQEKIDGAGRYRVTGFGGVTYWIHAHVNLKDGKQMHAEPVRFVLGEGAGPFRLVIASPYGNCPHYRGGWGGRQ